MGSLGESAGAYVGLNATPALVYALAILEVYVLPAPDCTDEIQNSHMIRSRGSRPVSQGLMRTFLTFMPVKNVSDSDRFLAGEIIQKQPF